VFDVESPEARSRHWQRFKQLQEEVEELRERGTGLLRERSGFQETVAEQGGRIRVLLGELGRLRRLVLWLDTALSSLDADWTRRALREKLREQDLNIPGLPPVLATGLLEAPPCPHCGKNETVVRKTVAQCWLCLVCDRPFYDDDDDQSSEGAPDT
jgi:hypothetical protein